ncbi:MAG: hypothetical protein R3B90_21405 [Planctomycetaceae bacterium]
MIVTSPLEMGEAKRRVAKEDFLPERAAQEAEMIIGADSEEVILIGLVGCIELDSEHWRKLDAVSKTYLRNDIVYSGQNLRIPYHLMIPEDQSDPLLRIDVEVGTRDGMTATYTWTGLYPPGLCRYVGEPSHVGQLYTPVGKPGPDGPPEDPEGGSPAGPVDLSPPE